MSQYVLSDRNITNVRPSFIFPIKCTTQTQHEHFMSKSPRPELTTTIERLSHEARGIAQIDGKTTFIRDALPGETVRFSHTRRRGRFDEGQTLEVLTASPERTSPHCAHFGTCGGCSLQHMQHDAQISHKEASLINLLQHQGHAEPKSWLPPLTRNTLGYRHKARLSIRYVAKKGKVLVGFRERDGRFVADLNQCHILHPSVGLHLSDISDCLLTLDARSSIPQIEIAIGDNITALIVRHLEPLSTTDLEKLKALAEQHQYRLYLQPKGPDSIHLYHPTNTSPLMQYSLSDHELTLQFHPSQFIQINPSMNQAMLNQAIKHLELTPNDHVLDLFCGIGNFSLPMAKQCHHVTGIEGDDTAVSQARANATHNHLNNTTFEVANLFEPEATTPWIQQRFDKVLLDPPRAGAQEILPFLNTWQPKIIVYISCNPATLARDTAIIQSLQYSLDKAGIMDMFPHTQHTEAMAVFYRN